jgi:hypothetical protein
VAQEVAGSRPVIRPSIYRNGLTPFLVIYRNALTPFLVIYRNALTPFLVPSFL